MEYLLLELWPEDHVMRAAEGQFAVRRLSCSALSSHLILGGYESLGNRYEKSRWFATLILRNNIDFHYSH